MYHLINCDRWAEACKNIQSFTFKIGATKYNSTLSTDRFSWVIILPFHIFLILFTCYWNKRQKEIDNITCLLHFNYGYLFIPKTICQFDNNEKHFPCEMNAGAILIRYFCIIWYKKKHFECFYSKPKSMCCTISNGHIRRLFESCTNNKNGQKLVLFITVTDINLVGIVCGSIECCIVWM